MPNNIGTLITAPVRPFSDLDTFATGFANELKGGVHCKNSLAELQAIPSERLEINMLGAIPGALYQFTDSGWQLFTGANPTPNTGSQETVEADGSIDAGQPVYLKPNLHLGLASQSSMTSALVAGIAITSGGFGESVTYQVDGVVELLDWSVATLGTYLQNGLYYLSSTGGLLTQTPGAGSGYYVPVGQAISPTRLKLIHSIPLFIG